MIPNHVKAILEQHGLRAIEFNPGATPTAEKAAEMLAVSVGQIAKSLVFQGKDGSLTLVVCAGDQKISSGKIKRLMGTKARLAGADITEQATGFRPGGVCPFGVTGMPIFIDISLKDFNPIYPAAGTDASGVPMSYSQLVEITGAEECDVTSSP